MCVMRAGCMYYLYARAQLRSSSSEEEKTLIVPPGNDNPAQPVADQGSRSYGHPVPAHRPPPLRPLSMTGSSRHGRRSHQSPAQPVKHTHQRQIHGRAAQGVKKHAQGIASQTNNQRSLIAHPANQATKEDVSRGIDDRIETDDEPDNADTGTQMRGVKSHNRYQEVSIQKAEEGDNRGDDKNPSGWWLR